MRITSIWLIKETPIVVIEMSYNILSFSTIRNKRDFTPEVEDGTESLTKATRTKFLGITVDDNLS